MIGILIADAMDYKDALYLDSTGGEKRRYVLFYKVQRNESEVYHFSGEFYWIVFFMALNLLCTLSPGKLRQV